MRILGHRTHRTVRLWRSVAAGLTGLALTCAPRTEAATPIKYAGPIVIFKGGVYRGNWESQNARVPAVTITTAQPVTIEYSNIRSRGPLIYSAFHKANVTVRNTRGEALNPNRPLKEYRLPGRFVQLEEFGSATIENNELMGTSGIYLRDYKGLPKSGQTVKIVRNRARNIDGRYSIGVGKYSDTRYHLVQFVQFNQVRRIPNVEIAWNEVINEPGKSRVEEVISMYLSSGVPSSSIKIHDNYIQGAYNVQPTKLDYGGAGMNLGDGLAKKPGDAASYIRAYNNQIVGTNSGIALSAGHDILAYNNRLISSGYLPDGRAIRGQNVGIYVWDFYNNKKYKTFYNVIARDNLVGWSKPLQRFGGQNPFWFPDCDRDSRGKSKCVNNRTVPGTITLGMEKAEYTRWQTKLRAAGLRVGVLPK
ncbi:hypothetical protein HNQ07_001394 [Deinococcus metalli]|uniref:Right-handed parallel beta-helix repeat-containing protein n=1 Tax=Deinococcus metalli TaxID=1141878 RepID=A0A7W8NRA3_9DEIO|nr:hypothetical protein [Deinococcus metalli]MBB5375937.1 hypothetical protein [Deinococcus metalli]GHF35970.1 hypothetical protein GCM10017781_10670 [Deinococcus metalli]